MMKSNFQQKRVAIVTESLWKMAGANRVLDQLTKTFPNADIYALFGDTRSMSESIRECNIYFSWLNRIPFIKQIYRYTFHLWPMAIEQFDFTGYDLVISNSSSVSHGVVTPLGCKHVAYINSPMRYLWDLAPLYAELVRFGPVKRFVKNFFLTINRVWDVAAGQRPDVLICNSDFVATRVSKYWGRKVDFVIYPPVSKYDGKLELEREDYFVSGAPFEPNKRGDFLLECAREIGFNLKIIGGGSMLKRLRRKYSGYRNIEFLGWVTEEEKWRVISKAKGFVVPGIEDYGIFCAEAISAGTPVLAYRGGGSLEIVKEGISGFFFDSWTLDSFGEVLSTFLGTEWDYQMVSSASKLINTEEIFREKIVNELVE